MHRSLTAALALTLVATSSVLAAPQAAADERYVGKKCVTLTPGGVDKFTVCDTQYDSMQISNRRTHYITATPAKCPLWSLNTRLRAATGSVSDEDEQAGVSCRQLAAVVAGTKKSKVGVSVKSYFTDVTQPISSYGFDPF